MDRRDATEAADAERTQPTESIEVCGVRFTAAEVVSVKIKRDGRTVEIREDSASRRIGFD